MIEGPGTITVTATAFSIPSEHHPSNQDAILLGSLTPVADIWQPLQTHQSLAAPLLFVVADGLGGHAGGEVASHLVTSQLARRASTLFSEESMSDALHEVNGMLYQAMEGRSDLAGMGSTVAALVVGEEWLGWCNIGDSAAFVWDPPYLVQLSLDDVPAGPVTGRVTQTLGGLEHFTGVEPHVGSEKFRFPARYLLCSDGLTKVFEVQELEDVMASPALKLAGIIADETVERGRPDDCSVIIIDIDGPRLPEDGSGEIT